jgi:2-aminoethylphosphonate-pyruvate transaminase
MARIETFRGPPGAEDRPWLMTPGPVSTARAVRLAQLADWDAADPDLRRMGEAVRAELLRLAGAAAEHVCILVPGALAVEAALALMASASKRSKTLVIGNGGAAEEAAALLEHLGRPFLMLRVSALQPVTAAEVDGLLAIDKSIGQVWLAPFSADAGVVTPVEPVAQVVKGRGRTLLVDAGVGFGALGMSMADWPAAALTGRVDGALESVTGLGFAIVPRRLLGLEARIPARALDLAAMAAAQETGRQCDLPGPALAALQAALAALREEGGPAARLARYRRNSDVLNHGMRALGFAALTPPDVTGPLLQGFHAPGDAAFDFTRFAAELRRRGFAAAAGAAGLPPSFRLAVMGQMDAGVITAAVNAVAESLFALGVDQATPAA